LDRRAGEHGHSSVVGLGTVLGATRVTEMITGRTFLADAKRFGLTTDEAREHRQAWIELIAVGPTVFLHAVLSELRTSKVSTAATLSDRARRRLDARAAVALALLEQRVLVTAHGTVH
jgi:hypothetical protein